MKSVFSRSAAVFLVALVPTLAYAQGAITGVVKDPSGGVLPGVTVEAASPVLIEKVRSVVTDSTGQYRVVNLIPGAYSVTFTLPGFSTVKRDGIELTGTFVATVNADMQVGSLEETITVRSESPTVDVQSVRQQQTVSKDVIAAIPTARTAGGLQNLIPGMNLTQGGSGLGGDVGGISGNTGGSTGAIHGGRMNDGRSLNDGLTTNHAGSNGGGGMLANVSGAQEIVISTSGGMGEAETGGVTLNIIPRDGSNSFNGTVFGNFSNGAMQASNYTQELKDRGLTSPSELLHMYDINPMGGGRILRDRLWFYATARWWGADNTHPGLFFNKNENNPNAWAYAPDTSRQAFRDRKNRATTLRLTWQATPRNKFTGYWSEGYALSDFNGGGEVFPTLLAPEMSRGGLGFKPSRIQQATWLSPVTNRLLLEAGFGTFFGWFGGWGPFDNPLGMINVVEQGGSIPGLSYRFPQSYSKSDPRQSATRTWRASASYVTGAHNMKFGYFGGFSNPTQPNVGYWGEIISYRFNNGVANQLTMVGVPGLYRTRNLVPTSFYGQDQWTAGRLTLQGGVRFDHNHTSYPDVRIGGTRLIPTEYVFPKGSTPGIHWNDITPRMGAAYDLFGNGKTAVKVNLGKYLESLVVGSSGDSDLHPSALIAVQTTRSWTDRNQNYVVDCDIANPDQNAECGDMTNKNFGKNIASRTYDPRWSEGWGNRPYNWELGVSVQQQIVPRVSVNVGYFRRWFGNWYMVDNLATSPSDYTKFSLTAPVDARLPGGGGQTISELYNLIPEKVGQVNERAQPAGDFGQLKENWQGVDLNLNARLQRGITIQGGVSAGRRLADNCAVRAVLPEMGANGARANFTGDSYYQPNINTADLTSSYCHFVTPYLTSVSGLATYTIPKVDVQVAGTWQSRPGPELAANYNVPNPVVRLSLGRDLSGGAANIPVNLVTPGTLYGDRINQLDLRVSKILRFGRTRTQVGFDIYNLANRDTPTTYNQTFVPNGSWLVPTQVMTARFVKIGVQVDF